MHLVGDRLVFAATDLSNYLACPHLSGLSRAVTLGEHSKPRVYDDPGAEVLRDRGLQHEAQFLARLREHHGNVVEIAEPEPGIPSAQRWSSGAESTRTAMQMGARVIFQGVLFDGAWLGKPDFLLRVPAPSGLGNWSYEVVDAKLAREAKAGAVLQISLYSDLLAAVQGRSPEHMHLALGRSDGLETFRVDDFAAYYRMVRRGFEAHLGSDPLSLTYPEPAGHCDICSWSHECDARRRADDHLCLVAGIGRNQRDRLVEREIETLAALGGLPLPVEPRLDGVSPAALEKIREQARIQLEGRERGEHLYELLQPVTEDEGLAALPPPSPGDLFFDIEGDPYAFDEGLEYLLGVADVDGEFQAFWALDLEEEKARFEEFIDFVIGRLDEHPDMHVYHYAAYEQTAIKRLAGRHATREDEVDRLLRGAVLVDLYRVVRQGLRASVESYSIKKMEPFYEFGREEDIRTANAALADFEAWLELGSEGQQDRTLLDSIEAYNRDDCISTLKLRDWLETLRLELEVLAGAPVPRPGPREQEPSEDLSEHLERVAALVAALTEGVPADPDERTPEQHARWLLAQLLGWHRREEKSFWWSYFTRLEYSDDELLEDRATLGGLTYEGVVDRVRQSLVHRYRFSPQDHDFRDGDRPDDPATGAFAGTVVAIDDVRGTIDLMRGARSEVPHPEALIPHDLVGTRVHQDSLLALAESVVAHGLGSEDDPGRRVAADILLREPPRVGQTSGADLTTDEEEPLTAAKRLAVALDRTVLPVQGPPGSGKTYSGGRMILALLQAGQRVGITANSHKVISNLLEAVCEAAEEAGVRLSALQKGKDEDYCDRREVEQTDKNVEVRDALVTGQVQLAAGTSWLWARPEMRGVLDVLVVDEAGQMSLANVLAVSQAASSLVLLGDPRQLEQPQKGVHPPGAGVSALEHLLGVEPTLSSDQGLFLPHTWRLHPEICAYTSELFYRGRLTAREWLENQRVDALDPFSGSGLRFVPVGHTGNRNHSPEEVAVVAGLFDGLLNGHPAGRRGGSRAQWTDGKGLARTLTLDDILVVAPYNAQVSALIEALPEGARVGTVDKFQGQEAPIVIYSMATSSAEEAPRGMEFLFSPNRLNVATSRAKCLAVLVGNPAILAPICRSPRQMQLANAFCRFAEMAGVDDQGENSI